MMGCSLFYKMCQEVDTVSKLILLGVPNSIKVEEINSLSAMDGHDHPL
jgi:hypothetical protein